MVMKLWKGSAVMDGTTHIPVLLAEAVEALAIRPDGIYVDATLGGGGHSEAILGQLTTGRLVAFDQDNYAIARARERLRNHHNVTFINANFAELNARLMEIGVTAVDGILYDLGVSSFQFDTPERGFSYQHDAPLDMRMDRAAAFSAYDIVNDWSADEIADILFRYGEESFGRQIARAIVKTRSSGPIRTTFELVAAIKSALPAKVLAKKGHPAKQTFQALRIAVNDELSAFSRSLEQATGLLNQGGRIVVITFHSLEDRIAKTFFRDCSTIVIPRGLAIIPTEKPLLRLVNSHVSCLRKARFWPITGPKAPSSARREKLAASGIFLDRVKAL